MQIILIPSILFMIVLTWFILQDLWLLLKKLTTTIITKLKLTTRESK